MPTDEELMQAVADYQAGRLGTIPAIHGAPTTIRAFSRSSDWRARTAGSTIATNASSLALRAGASRI